MRSTSSAGAQALQTFLTRLLVAVLSIVAGVIIARTLGPAGKGTYSAVQLLLALPLAVTGGTGAAITYVLTKGRWSVRDLVAPLGVLFAITVAVCCAGAAVYAVLKGWTGESIAFAIALPAGIVVSWQPSFYVATDRLRRFNAQCALQAFCTTLGIWLVCGLARGGVAGALAVWIACAYGCAAVVIADILKAGARSMAASLFERVRTLAAYGTQTGFNAGLGALNYRIDALLLTAMLGVAAFGTYSIAVTAGEMLFMLVRPVTMAVAREIGSASGERAAELTAATVRFGAGVSAVAAAVMAAAATPLIHVVYGPKFAGATLPLLLLLPGIVAFTSAGTFASYFGFQLGRPAIVTGVNVVMIAVQTAACLLLVPRYGAAGAALASSAAYAIGAAINTAIFCRFGKMRPAQLWIPRLYDLRRACEVLSEIVPRGRPCAQQREAIVITGAAGNVASLLRPHLRAQYALRLTDRRRVGDPGLRETFVRANMRSVRAMQKVLCGARAVVHLGAVSREAPFEDIVRENVRALYTLLEAARLEGVRRVVFASTGHVTGFYSRDQHIDESAPPRPDTLYAVSKAFGELLCRHYADKHGFEILCIRIGHVSDAPQYPVDRHIWISPRDLAHLISLGIDAPDLHFETVYGVSDNAQRWWSLKRARSLGYEPQDAAGEPLPPEEGVSIAALLQGESFAARGFTARNFRR